mmetsp:Transcript_45209/g.104804  ORF Transcript_45209/g.104804 Transcript_45209/m.104804 type:complete len:456 (-) Transcript_45209:12-1379(-)
MAEQGAATSTLGNHNEEVEGLHELFSIAVIEGYLSTASAILREWGAVDITEVTSDKELVLRLEADLKLKPLEKQRLQNAIMKRKERYRCSYEFSSQSAVSSLPPPAAVVSQDGPPGITHPAGKPHATLALDENVVVRNTFLDVDQQLSPSQHYLWRSKTTPPGQASVPESAQSAEDAGVSRACPVAPSPHGSHNLDRTVTHDHFSYNPADRGTWCDAHALAMAACPPIPPPWLPPPPPLPFGWLPQMYTDKFPDQSYTGPSYQQATSDSSWRQVSGGTKSAGAGTQNSAGAGANTKNGAGDIPVLNQRLSEDGKTTQVWWAVSTKKLRSSDTSIVSPRFDCVLSPELPKAVFKLMIYPKEREGANFSQSKGRGIVKLVAADSVPELAPRVSFSLSIGPDGGTQFSRGPVVHNFSEQKVCGLPEEEEEWNFKAAVNPGTTIFMVNVQIEPVIEPSG